MTGKVFPTDRMTSRERLLAAYRGQEVDRLPYWAKVCNANWRGGQPERIALLSDFELLDFIHADGLFHLPHFLRAVSPHVTVEQSGDGNVRTVVTHTPDGDLVAIWTTDPVTRSPHPTEFPLKTAEDIRRYRWLLKDARIEVDEAARERMVEKHRRIGDRGISVHGAGTSPLMDLVEHIAGPVNTTYLLMDHPDEMNELIGLMHANLLKRIRRMAELSPADVIASTENTSTTLISPEQFEKYCYGHLCDYAQAVRGEGKMHELHMCGHTRALLEKIDAIPSSSIEAFTAPPLGNTRLVDGRTKAPSKTLIGGTNAMVWLEPVEKIRAFIEGELAACPDRRRIILTTAGEAPQKCPAETFRAIGEWLPTAR